MQRQIGDNDIVIVASTRTPLGSFQGIFSSLPATELGSLAIKGALSQVPQLDPSAIDEVYFGNVLSAGMGQAPARQAALGAGLSTNCVCTTVNKVCASGMKAIMLGAQAITTGQSRIVVAGGMENMTRVPHLLPQARSGMRMGNSTVVDAMVQDGLWDPYNDCHMGIAAERCADQYQFTREDQDRYSTESYQAAMRATTEEIFASEITPVQVSTRNGPVVYKTDEELDRVKLDKISQLKPAFKKGGSVTAGNASSISDGAAAVILTSYRVAKEMNLPVRAVIRGFADASQDPMDFTTSPAKAIPLALKRANIEADQVDYYEVNEAFSVVALANMKLLNVPRNKMNIFGGGVSIGHPIGCSGSRIVVTLLNVLENTQTSIGVAGICNGGGGASALVIERVVS